MGIRTNSMVMSIGFLFVVAACGGSPKPEPGTGTSTPTATPPSPDAAAATPVSTGDATASADAGAGDGGSGGGKAAECTALRDEAQSEMDAERIKVDKICKKDADCMVIKGRACAFNCTSGAIPKAEEKDWTSELEKVKSGPCKKWTDMDCEKIAPPRAQTCTQEGKKASCQAGHCTLK